MKTSLSPKNHLCLTVTYKNSARSLPEGCVPLRVVIWAFLLVPIDSCEENECSSCEVQGSEEDRLQQMRGGAEGAGRAVM